jgi:hypothetical protein
MTKQRSSVFFALALFIAAPIYALEHTYPGTMCVEVNSNDQRQKPIRDSNGQLFNGSPSHTLEVVCPVVGPWNDLSPNAEGTEVSNVFVTDRSASENICCESRANNVGTIYRSAEVCSSGISTQWQTLVLTPPVVNFTFTSRYFYCRIPPADGQAVSGIRLYRH